MILRWSITLALNCAGTKNGRSLLIEDGVLPWIVQNANNEASPIRRHIELALCHLAQHGKFLPVLLKFEKADRPLNVIWDASICYITEVNAKDMISGGALWELVRISRDCSREDIRTLANRTLTSSPTFQAEMRRLGIDYQWIQSGNCVEDILEQINLKIDSVWNENGSLLTKTSRKAFSFVPVEVLLYMGMLGFVL